MVKIPSKTVERELFRDGYRSIIAVDEVGMACLAGPVTVCAVRIDPAFIGRTHRQLAWLRDSKLLSPDQRERYADALMLNSELSFRVASCSPRTIDRMNIYQASRHAMRRAIRALMTDAPTMVLVDGNKRIQGIGLEQRPIVGGDRSVFSIAAASVIAKVHRDRVMERYARAYPRYGFERHKGYPTAYHRLCLRELGPCPLHRRSFRLT